MTIEEKVLAVWSARSDAIALVPASRFKPPGNWQALERPYIIQYPVAEFTINTHSTSPAQPLRIWEFYQLSVIADSYSSAKAIAEKIRSVFNGNYDGVQFFYRGQRFVGVDDVTRAEHIAVDLRIAEAL